jgi:TPP-dependent pyruvate/acetoin dehydrogenase alpha subunit
MGKPGGVCGGRGGSQHLHHRNFYSNGIQGGIVPVATGMAMAEKLGSSGAIVAVFIGDGTLGEGALYESFNMASLWQLPVLFVLDNNGYSQSTPFRLQVAGSMKSRPEAFGIPVEERETTDVLEVLSLASQVADAVRTECRPHCLILHTYRLGPHSKGDDDRDPSEIEAAWDRDPVKIARRSLDSAQADLLEAEVIQVVDQARERAIAAAPYEHNNNG